MLWIARILNHPVTYAILFYLFWILVTSVTSSMPLVSFKFLLARIWFIAVIIACHTGFQRYKEYPVSFCAIHSHVDCDFLCH